MILIKMYNVLVTHPFNNSVRIEFVNINLDSFLYKLTKENVIFS